MDDECITSNAPISEIAISSKLGIDATKILPGEGFSNALTVAHQNAESSLRTAILVIVH